MGDPRWHTVASSKTLADERMLRLNMADRDYGIVGATARTYGNEHWRIIKNQARIGKAFRLQRGHWYSGELIGAGWGRDEFRCNYEESYDTREEANAARLEWQRKKEATNG